ncbi:MAG: ABC transporter ATP-binding protein [Chloroflexi bacterium]|nr:ABC transporter ATP-binding protein [Chloroflexota bacterium]
MHVNVQDIFVNYGSFEVLSGVNLKIEDGKINVLLGVNGSGKTTLLKTICGLLHPSRGTIWYEERRIDGLPAYQITRLGIGHIPQGRMVFGDMTVVENLKVGAYSRSNGREVSADIEAMYERFPRLKERQKSKAGLLSGGEQQMLAIARALMARPKLLLMDEPSEGLSPKVVEEVANIITGINRDGITILLVEHNLRLGLSLAHNVFVLEDGVIGLEAQASDLSRSEFAKRIHLGGKAEKLSR